MSSFEPGNADALNNLAFTCGELGANLDEAVVLCHRAIQLQTGRRAYYLDTLGGVLQKQGKLQEAVVAFTQALAAVPERDRQLSLIIQQRLAGLQGK